MKKARKICVIQIFVVPLHAFSCKKYVIIINPGVELAQFKAHKNNKNKWQQRFVWLVMVTKTTLSTTS